MKVHQYESYEQYVANQTEANNDQLTKVCDSWFYFIRKKQ